MCIRDSSYTTDIVFRAAQIHSVEQSVTGFFSVSYHLFYTRISCDKLAEIIISAVVDVYKRQSLQTVGCMV